MDIIIRDVEEKNGQYKIYNKDGTGGHWYITKESAGVVDQIEPLVMQKIAELMKQSKVIKEMFDKDFWDIHYLDIKYRKDGQSHYEEADWLKDLWYLVKDSNFSE